ncbi:MAG: DUF393 domain-containing protein [Pseudomonadota bacterium]
MTNSAFSVYFDGGCPLCRKEIEFYRRMRGADAINWLDLTQSNDSDLCDGLTCEIALKRFHIRNRNGTILSGADAFIALWKELPSTRWLGHVIGLPGLRQIAELAYRAFLPVRPYLQKAVAGT